MKPSSALTNSGRGGKGDEFRGAVGVHIQPGQTGMPCGMKFRAHAACAEGVDLAEQEIFDAVFQRGREAQGRAFRQRFSGMGVCGGVGDDGEATEVASMPRIFSAILRAGSAKYGAPRCTVASRPRGCTGATKSLRRQCRRHPAAGSSHSRSKE